MRKRALIIGTAGMLGEYVKNVFDVCYETFCYDIEPCDWSEIGDVRDKPFMRREVNKILPDIIINLAALTSLEECEEDRSDCFMTNTIGAINMMEIAKERNIPYVFISTAGIFDGEKDKYTEEDQPNPLGNYAHSKWYAENYILNNYENAWIFRAGWMMGGKKAKDKKFVGLILKQIENGATELRIVNDKLGVPTYAKDFAESIFRVTEEKLEYGVYNMVCTGKGSRLQVAEEMIKILGLDIKIEKVSSDYFVDTFSCKRPASEILVNSKLEIAGKNYMRDWKECLAEYLNEFYL